MIYRKPVAFIAYILADDMGIGDASCYNPESKIFTPNIDRLAAHGVRFTDAHTSSAVCTPTGYGILKGRYNWRSTLKSSVFGEVFKSVDRFCPVDRREIIAGIRIPDCICWQMAPGMGHVSSPMKN